MEEFSGTETIAAPIEKVWAYLLDVHNVAACTPGFQSLEELGEEHWKAVVSIGVGPVKAKFTLDVTRPEKHEPDLMVVQARMDWTAQVTVSGTIASVGTRLLHQTAEKLTGQFFECLKTKLQTTETAGSGG
ncbi:MAG: carbon monoxide dehydrogenase [Chloroflexi bacterium]|nr:MAG: carbon monoxide dehydrogenase [Chloroflexota bacterium]